jgi:deazaflavin-dependent oxidoreductase (nitroreductase family)
MATSEILLEESPYLNLTTKGRKTGLQHSVELWFVFEDGKLLFLAHENSHWWKNIEKNPRVEVEVSEILFQGKGRLIQEKLDHVFTLFRKKYGSSQVERWYGKSRGMRKSVEIELEKVLGKRPVSKLSMGIST